MSTPRVTGDGTSVSALVPVLSQEARMAIVAGAQHDVLTHAQLRDLGYSASAIQRLVRSGRVRRLHRGVYLLGHRPPTERSRLFAAVLASGTEAVVSHRSAASLHGLLPWRESVVDVTSPREPPTHRGVRGHRTTLLRRDDVTLIDGIPVTSVARTFVDAGAQVGSVGLERMWRRADELRVLDPRALLAQLGASRPGVAAASRERTAADEGQLAGFTRSDLEMLFLRIVRTARLPTPVTNVQIEIDGGRPEVDALWPDQRVVVELDGWGTHGNRRGFERDRRRDAELSRLGYRTLRFTWRRVVGDPVGVASTLRDVLRA
jgi:very-short-patch-repair endonuclease